MPMWKAIDVARACRACLAALPLLILSASLAEALYGPRTTIGTHYQQMSTTTSTDGIDQGSVPTLTLASSCSSGCRSTRD